MRTPLRISHGKITLVSYCKPHRCGGSCVYCFSVPGFTKSVTSNEDTKLARDNNWSAEKQIRNRFQHYNLEERMGLKCDLAAKGESFCAYDEAYLIGWVKGIYDFLNGQKSDSYKDSVDRQKNGINRCVTFKVETRPDQINEKTCRMLKTLGVTTVELGVQSLDDRVLETVNRGHGVGSVIDATELLRSHGFEVVYQVMVGLPGRTSTTDHEMLAEQLWENPFCPDAIKIYPCLLLNPEYVRQKRLIGMHDSGKWKPMTREEYVQLLFDVYPHIPSYVHINRIQRILPETIIAAGPKSEINREIFNGVSRCLWQRSPAQKRKVLNENFSEYTINSFKQGDTGWFIEATCSDDTVLGYARLTSLSKDVAVIRDVRVLGNMIPVDQRNDNKLGSQHIGIGTCMLKYIKILASDNGFSTICVRPAPGVVNWFSKRGFSVENKEDLTMFHNIY